MMHGHTLDTIQHRRNSQQDEIVVDIGVALKGNKDGQFKQKYAEVAKGTRSLQKI
jgi:hypothetical protein